MPALIHQAKHLGEFTRIDALLRFERMLTKEARDLAQLLEASHPVFPSLVVVSTDAPKTEESLQSVECVDIAHVLNDAKFRYDLKTDLDRRASPDTY